MVAAETVAFAPVRMSLADAEFLEERRFQVAEVCRVFRVPLGVVDADVGSGASRTYANAQDARRHFLEFSVNPWLAYIEAAISNHPRLCPPESDTYVEFVRPGLLEADLAAQADVLTKALDPSTGWLRRDEARRLLNLEPERVPRAPRLRRKEERMRADEQRTVDVDVQDLDTRGRSIVGYAAVYGALSDDLGGFRERIEPGAFAGVLDSDVRCLVNHDPSQVLGRTRSGTLRLADEERGLRFECDLPDSPLGENVREAVRRGDVDGASFRFQVGEERW